MSETRRDATLDARAAELIADAATLARHPRSTIDPYQLEHTDEPGQRAVAALRAGRNSIELGRTLGEGGMGVVRAATQLALGREVAVKSLKDGVSGENATLELLREAWVTGALEHPNVVPVHDIAIDEAGRPRIVLKRIAGASWAELMHDVAAQRARFAEHDSFAWNVRILVQVCNAVHFAHSRGIVHRDLKPENVMIGEFGEVYVLDWGIAVAMHDDGTGRFRLASSATELAGTPAYLAPEMMGGKPSRLSPRTDVYLLGAMLYEVVTGGPPHDAPTLMGVLTQVATSTPPLPEGTPDEVTRIVRRAMALDPGDRFESAEQLRTALVVMLERRGSLALCERAEARLEELVAARPSLGDADDPEARRAEIDRLFLECRFAFREALTAWSENERARRGLAIALETRIEIDLAAGDPRAAARLLSEHDSPPPELTTRVAAAKRAREVEDARRDALERDADTTIGRRTRAFIAMTLGVTWTIMPLAIHYWLEPAFRGHGSMNRAATVTAASVLAFACGLAYWARDSLSRTAVNRQVSWLVAIVLGAQFAFFASGDALGLEYVQVRVIMALVYTVVALIATAIVERRLAPAAATFVVTSVLAVNWPEHSNLLQAVANGILTITFAVVWSRPHEDVVEAIRARRRARRK